MSELARRGVCLVVAAPSGTGKSTVTRALLALEARLSLSVSVTTRPPRSGESEGVHYYYKSEDAFRRMAETGALLEHATVFGRSYGTPREPVEAALAAGCDVALDIDCQGYRQIRAALPADTVGVFLLPPSLALLEQRLRGRASESPAEVARRLAAARGEIAHAGEFDHLVVNEALDQCVATVRAILIAARCTVGRSLGALALAEKMQSA